MNHGTQRSASHVLGFIERYVRDYKYGERDEQKDEEVFEGVDELNNALHPYPEAQEHLQALEYNISVLFRTQASLDETRSAQKDTLLTITQDRVVMRGATAPAMRRHDLR